MQRLALVITHQQRIDTRPGWTVAADNKFLLTVELERHPGAGPLAGLVERVSALGDDPFELQASYRIDNHEAVANSMAIAGVVPKFIEPMAARAVQHLPQGPEWLYELKLDGYRALVLKDRDSIRILSRKDKDLTRSYPSIVAAAAKLEVRCVTLDGEIVAIDETGRPSFQALQHPKSQRATIVYYAFDVLHVPIK
jgi:ATP-dependent DNA ligase